MGTRRETERVKLIQEKCQSFLISMLRDDDNKYCVDCDAKGPRWASWNLGIFLCIRCAGIHRNLGVHISRVKSVNLDSWTPEQVVSLQQMGNSRARAVYEAQLPDGFRRPQTDSALENFIRAKYEHKKYLAREWVPPPPPKVNWEKDIDDEIEKQKRKKKSTQSSFGIVAPLSENRTSALSIKTSPLPAPLPKPKPSNSPKTLRNLDHTNAAGLSITNNSDLLGLSSPTNPAGPGGSNIGKATNDLQNDTFSNFLSAPPAANILNGDTKQQPNNDNTDVSAVNSLAKEEADFFNQPNLAGPHEQNKGKLTKDSILALYGSAPLSSLGQFNQNPLLGGFNATNSFVPTGAPAAIPVTAGNFMPMANPMQQTQTFPAMLQQTHPVQFGHQGQNLNLNLAGMPQGLLGPPQSQPHTQFMTPPHSTAMYNQPVMTAPGAFTSASSVPQQMMPQSQFAAQFPSQQSLFGGMPSATIPGFLPPMTQPTATASQSTSGNLSQQFGNLNLNLGNVWQ